MKKYFKNYSVLITALCTAVYFCSYLTRYNFNAVLVEIAAAEKYSDVLLSMSITGLFISYGIGQLVSGYMGDRMPPQYIIFGGLLTSALMNGAMPLCKSPYAMLVVWCVNGFAQSMIWPPLVKILASKLNYTDYKRATTIVSCGSSAGTIAVYVLSPACIVLLGWRFVFVISGAVAFAMSFIWIFGYKKCKYAKSESTDLKQDDETPPNKALSLSLSAKLMFAIVIPAIIAQGTLRDGISTWLPTLLSDTFKMKTVKSILTGVALPVFGMMSFKVANVINKKFVANEISCGGLMFVFGFLMLALTLLTDMKFKLLSVLCITLAVGAMHGVNLMLICMLPSRLRSFGKVSFISGFLNTCTYVGSAVSIYGTALFKNAFGWEAILIAWCVIALIGSVCCFISGKMLNNVE